MTSTKLASIIFIVSTSLAHGELVNITENELAEVSGQSGITLEGNVDLTIGDISYQQTPESAYHVLHDIVANYEYGPTTIDMTSAGSLRIDLPEYVNFNELSLSLYSSITAQVDSSASNAEIYTIYASTLGPAHKGFTLNINGTELDSGGNNWEGSYENTSVLENNASNTFTITEANDISIRLESDDSCCFGNEDYAQITIVDDKGNIVKQSQPEEQNDVTLTHSFDTAIENNFVLQATLTGTFKM